MSSAASIAVLSEERSVMHMTLSVPLRRTVVLGVPLILGLLEVEHIALIPSDDILATLTPIATWWTVLHVAQIPLFALLGCAAFLLVCDLDSRAARISRRAIAVFVVLYPAFDATVGVSSGVIAHSLGTLTPDQHASVEQGLQALFWGPVTGLMAIVASASWLVALIAVAWALRQVGAPRTVVGLLALSGVLLGIAHIRPIGPLACLSFLIAAAWIELRWDERQSA